MRRCPQPHRPTGRCGEQGAAVVEYVLVLIVVLGVFVAVVQMAVLLHARDVLVADAAEGARTAALVNSSLPAGNRDCETQIVDSLPGLAADAHCTGQYLSATETAPPLVSMVAAASVPVWLLPGGHVQLRVVARAVREPAP